MNVYCGQFFVSNYCESLVMFSFILFNIFVGIMNVGLFLVLVSFFSDKMENVSKSFLYVTGFMSFIPVVNVVIFITLLGIIGSVFFVYVVNRILKKEK